MELKKCALAYIIGVYLGDGWITAQRFNGKVYYNFGVAAIDREFVERVKSQMEVVLGEETPAVKQWTDRLFAYQVGRTPFFKAMQEDMCGKTTIPLWIQKLDPLSEEMTEFFRGVIDSEGCITRGKKAGWFNFMMGAKGRWFLEVVKLLRVRFKTLPLNKYKGEMWCIEKPLYSFLQAHIPLTINRKRERIREYLYKVSHRTLPSETIRWTSLEYGDEDIVRATQ